jgi:hypothetical protein
LGRQGAQRHNTSGTRLSDNMLDPSTHVHLSVELTHGAIDLRTSSGWDLNVGIGPVSRAAASTGCSSRLFGVRLRG